MAQAAPSANPLPAVGGVGSADTGSKQQNGSKNTNEYFGDVLEQKQQPLQAQKPFFFNKPVHIRILITYWTANPLLAAGSVRSLETGSQDTGTSTNERSK